ncbi:MAG: transposase, partial [Tannerella sp.]|nr:transposase [Tannerella sp.]
MNTSVFSSIPDIDPQLIWCWYRDHLSEMHTIPSNRETGKTALMVRSMKYEDIEKLLDGESLLCRNVETLTRDLSPLYAKVGNELFFNSSAIADRFHVIRSLMESCRDVRVRLWQDLLRDRRVKYTDHRKQEKERKKECRALGKEYVIEHFKYDEE